MSTLNDDDLFVVERAGTLYQVRSDEMSTLNDTDLFVVERGGVQYKVEAVDVGTGGVTGTIGSPVEVLTPVNGAGLNDGQPYDPLSSAITGVFGAGSVNVETAEITSYVENSYVYSDWLTSYDGFYSGAYVAVNAFNGINDNGAASAGGATSHLTYQHPAALTVYSMEVRCYSAVDITFGVGQVASNIAGVGTNDQWVNVPIPNGTFDFTGSNSIQINLTGQTGGIVYFNGIKLNGVELVDNQVSGVLTLASDQNLSSFGPGDSITQDSGYTPQTSAIVSQEALTPPAFTVTGGSTSQEWTNVFSDSADLIQTSSSTFDTCIFTVPLTGVSEIRVQGEALELDGSGTYGKIIQVDPDGQAFITPAWTGSLGDQTATFDPPINVRQIRIGISTASTHTARISFDGVFLSDISGTELTLTDDTDLENFRVGDEVRNGSGTTTTLDVDASVIGALYDDGQSVRTITQANFSSYTYYSNDETSSAKINNRGLYLNDPGNTSKIVFHYSVGTIGDTIEVIYGVGNSGSNTATMTYSGDVVPLTDSITQTKADLPKKKSVLTTTALSGTITMTLAAGGQAFVHYIEGMDNIYNCTGIGASSITVDGGTWNVGDTVTGPTLAAATGTVASKSGSELTLSSVTSRWIANAGKTAQKSSAYDIALTFTDDTELSNMIGVATQANADGSDYDTVETSAVTQVDQVTIPISGGGIAWSSGLSTEATWTDYPDLTTFDFENNSSYTIDSVSDVSNNPAMGIWESDSPNGPWTRWSSISWNELPYNQSINKRYVRFSLYGGSQTTNATVSLTNAGVAATALTLTDDTNLDKFEVGDLLTSGDSVTAVGPSNSLTVDGGTWNVGDTVSKSITPATIGTVVTVDGTTLYGSTVTGNFYTGLYLRGAEVTAEAPSPSEIVFTSSNGGTTAFSGTNVTLTGRRWDLESGSSAVGPWTTVGSYFDTSANVSQDGATPWDTAPSLLSNTYYRVKVAYLSDNATTVESNQNTFRTGDA